MNRLFLLLPIISFVFTGCESVEEISTPETSVQDVSQQTPRQTTSTLEQKQTISGIYQILSEQSKMYWSASKVTGTHEGVIRVPTGLLTLEDGAIVGGNFEVNMDTIQTTDAAGAGLDPHLKGENFFDATNYPLSTFVVTSATKEGNINHVTGNLTIKDITNPITFDATIKYLADGKISTTAEFTIDRTLWGIKFGSGKFFQGLGDKMIYDEIGFRLDLVFTKAS
ncbi:YceI family protein [Candidatus Gracilibacteria bacterium]|nr:YceI family protein [Candidatus Gracilibacteria bacterium]